MKKLKLIFGNSDLRRKILYTLGIIFIYRLMAQVSIPGVDLASLKAVFEQNQFLSIFSLLTGGSAENFSIVLMGLGPYINASIIVQLLTVVVPKFEELSKEGEQGRRKLNSITRWLTLPLALLQSYGTILLLNAQAQLPIIKNIDDPMVILPIMLTVSAGSVLLMWLGEQISENGLSNGVSLLIFTSIISTVPTALAQNLLVASKDIGQLIPVIAIVLMTVALIVATVLFTDAYRRIPVAYASKSAKGAMSELPIKVNQAGMIPIIFAVSVVTFPTIAAQLMQNSANPLLQSLSSSILTYFSVDKALYLITLFALIVGFTYFYVSITFNTEKVAENIQKRGGYIPGIRPGKETADYLHQVSHRLNLFGGLFIGGIAVVPILAQKFIGTTGSQLPLLISGAGILIIVGVILELIRQVDTHLINQDYSKFL
jgi:preprotein translocase subunit SecY